jgi:hypothetical protein
MLDKKDSGSKLQTQLPVFISWRSSGREAGEKQPLEAYAHGNVFVQKSSTPCTLHWFALHGLRSGSTRGVLWSRANNKYGGKEANTGAFLKQE